MLKRLCLALLCAAALCLTGCAALERVPEAPAPALPQLRLLTLPEYEPTGDSVPVSAPQGVTRADLWLDASQVMGGINPYEEGLYPHSSRKYREGGFHYRYQGTVGMYENVLRDALAAVEGARVRVLRAGNERLPDAFLLSRGLITPLTPQDEVRSLRRDMLTVAIDPLPTLFSTFSAEDMSGSFYSLGSPMLNSVGKLQHAQLENPDMASQMTEALAAQLASLNTDGSLNATGDDAQSPLLYALDNLDLSRLSIITCDPATLRRLTLVGADGSSVALVQRALEQRGVFEAGLCVGLYALRLDYMGQMISFAAADFSEPLLWGRLNYNNRTRQPTGALPMPRTLLMLVVGAPGQVDDFTAAFEARLAQDSALKEARGPANGELTYAWQGQTVAQQPFRFEWRCTRVERPSVPCYTRAELTTSRGEVLTGAALDEVALLPDGSGAHADAAFTLRIPAAHLPDGVSEGALSSAALTTDLALTLHRTLPNAPGAQTAQDEQVIALRNTLYVFALEQTPDAASAFRLREVRLEGDTLVAQVDVSGDALRAGRCRLTLHADLPGERIPWPEVAWADAWNAGISNGQVAAWETFTRLVTRYDRDSQYIPAQFTHAWGDATARDYHGMAVPDCPPVWLAPGLNELLEQLRAATAERYPLIRCTFDVFVTGDEAFLMGKGER